METIFSKFLTRLEKCEKDGQLLNIDEFENLKKEILSSLQFNPKIRFKKLVFYEILGSEEIESEDIPF